MFYLVEVEDYIRVEPRLFGMPTREAVEKQLAETYLNYSDKELGFVVAVVDVMSVGEGIIISGDGAAYYNSEFKLLIWRPELQELTFGVITEITNFGAFMDLGIAQGMIHISQTMEDYVSFSKTNTLIGKSSKKSLRKGDLCLARIVALSYKTGEMKIGLTMRQPGLGKLEWLKEEKRRIKRTVELETKKQTKKETKKTKRSAK